MAHLTTVENNIPDTPAIDPAQNYFRVYVALTLEEFQLLSQQQTTLIPELNYNLPIHDLPSDIRMPIYDSLPLHLRLSEAVNFYYYNLTSLHFTTQYINSMVIVQLHLPQEVLLRFVSAGQVTNFSRNYVGHMISITDKHHLPTRQLLPELLNYFDQPQQLQDRHYKSINTILHKSATYYGIALRYTKVPPTTATNLSMQHKLLLHNFLTTTGQALAPPECDYNRLRGGPHFLNTFTTNHYAGLDYRIGQAQNYRVHHWSKHT